MGLRDRRLKLSNWLHGLFDHPDNIYFDPPESKKLDFPAIVYIRDAIDTVNADNRKYLIYDRYRITFIHKDRDNDTVDKILDLPRCEHDREFKQNDMYHDVFTIYIQ